MIRALFFALVVIAQLPPALAQPGVELTPDLINERVAALKANGAADDSEVVLTYEQVRTLLNQAEAYDRDTATYVDALTSAPEREAEIQQRLDELDEFDDPAAEIAGFTPEELIARLALARAEERDLASQMESLDRRLAARETNATAIRDRLLQIDAEIAALPDEVITIDPSATPSLPEANQWRNAATSLVLSAEDRAKEAQLASQPVRFSAMTAERAELAGQLRALQALTAELETQTGTVQATVEPAELEIDETDPAYAIAVALVERDARLAELRVTTNNRLADARAINQEITRRLRALEDRYATARRIVDFGGESDVLGRVLLTYWEEIGEFRMDDPTVALSREVSSTVIRRIDHEEALSEILSASTFVNNSLRDAGLDPAIIPARTSRVLLELARGLRERLRAIIAAESEYIQSLSTLETNHAALSGQIGEYTEFLEGLIMWIPNHSPLWTTTTQMIVEELRYIDARVRSIELSFSPWLMAASLTMLLLLGGRARLTALQQSTSSQIARPRDDSIGFTLLALGAAVLRAAPVPILLLGLTSLFNREDSAESLSLSNELFVTALVLFTLSLMRIISEPSGIARVHFNWKADTMDRIHRELGFLIRWWLPLAVLAATASRLTPNTGGEAIGRILMLLVIVVIIIHFGRTQLAELRAQGSSWFRSTQNRLRVLLVLTFLMLMLGIVYGQVFTVLVISRGLINTLWAGIGLLLTHAVLVRWLRVARRRLRLQELLAQRDQQAGGATEEGGSVEEQVAGIVEISSETQQLVNVATIATALTAALLIWEPLLPAADALSRVDLWTSTSEVDGETVVTQITLATVLTILVLAGLTLFAAKRLPALVELALRSRTNVSPSARYTTSTLLNYLIVGTGIVLALGALGLKWSQLQWLIAALGVGIGFGLQEIVANFISGLIILFERPIRVGDIISIGDKDGTVIKIRIRATTIRDWDGKELLVPNKEFITGRLLNWTLSDSQTRLVIPVGIAYGSDVRRALSILEEVVHAHPKVLAEPAPTCFFLGFGDNSLTLHARCFLASTDDRLPTLSDLHTQINDAFNAAGIVIAFPQRDIHFDADQPLRIAIERHATASTRTAN